MRCIIACLAVWAAMRPKFRGVTSTSTVSPSCAFGLSRRALVEVDLVLRVGDVLYHDEIGQSSDVAGLRIDVDAQVARGADALLRGGEKGVRNRLEQDLALDSALPLQVVQHGNKFRVHKRCSPQTKKSGTSVPTPSSADSAFTLIFEGGYVKAAPGSRENCGGSL